ncbi:glycosyltransferase family 2 protein [Dehalobacterium formicoaceticum]|uniref:Glycosyltransferase family 2 protein n=1 Tax=Dehalobacterium formicoaceticum TaxID=51515 RepID=A0ABT1Y4L3_9FIRM|nr:glycosyltransferase family 2 protein [Dehalobacterium formicoaceticum]MCR6545809.1 glycosyltransferase family 2 protein [Dehalobacterium formicoaceticum]
MEVSLLIPAYNAGALIQQTIQSVQTAFPDFKEIIVVDDGSQDDTKIKAANAGARVLRLEKNRGKGNALNQGAPLVQGEIVVLLDADLGESAAMFMPLLIPVLNQKADVTIAKFPPPPIKGGFGWVKGLARHGIFSLTGKNIVSPLSGQRVMTREVFQSLLPFQEGFGVEVGAAIDILKQGWRWEEIEIDNLHHAYTGRNLGGFLHRGRQFYDISRTLIKKSGERS